MTDTHITDPSIIEDDITIEKTLRPSHFDDFVGQNDAVDNLKLYIDVNEQIRAKRRYKQLIDSGEKSIYPKILKDIKLRDKQDKSRKHSPLVIPKGAYIVNNNGSFKNTTKQVSKLIEEI